MAKHTRMQFKEIHPKGTCDICDAIRRRGRAQKAKAVAKAHKAEADKYLTQ